MRALLDVNVLIALLDSGHVSHGAAREWFTAHAELGWASCPITQNGCMRIMAHGSYPNAKPVAEIARRLRDATAHPIHEFWPDSVSVLDGACFDHTRVHGPKQLTDVYLLGLAVNRNGRLVTFDRSIPLSAVRGATANNLVVL